MGNNYTDMGDTYNYFSILLNECLESVNQFKLKAEVIESYRISLSDKSENLQNQINRLNKVFFSEDGSSIIQNLNRIEYLIKQLNEKDVIINSLNFEIFTLKGEILKLVKNNNNHIDDLPF